MDSGGNSLVSASKKWLALAELTCNWQLKRGNSRKFHGARGILTVADPGGGPGGPGPPLGIPKNLKGPLLNK